MLAFYGVQATEHHFAGKPSAPLDAADRKQLDNALDSLLNGLNTLRRRQGMEELTRD
jgi:hypothetical protein